MLLRKNTIDWIFLMPTYKTWNLIGTKYKNTKNTTSII